MVENIEIEHPAGVDDLDREEKLEAKKWALKQSIGKEKYERLMGTAKQFFNLRKKETLRELKKQP